MKTGEGPYRQPSPDFDERKQWVIMKLEETSRRVDDVIDQLWEAKSDMTLKHFDEETTRLCDVLQRYFLQQSPETADQVAHVVDVSSEDIHAWAEKLGRVRKDTFMDLWNKYRTSRGNLGARSGS